MHDDTIAVKHDKNYLKKLWNGKRNKFQAKMKKTCPKKITAFNYTKNVEQTYKHSILIKSFPHGKVKKLMLFTK